MVLLAYVHLSACNAEFPVDVVSLGYYRGPTYPANPSTVDWIAASQPPVRPGIHPESSPGAEPGTGDEGQIP